RDYEYLVAHIGYKAKYLERSDEWLRSQKKRTRHSKSDIRNLKDMKKNKSLSRRVYILITVMGLWGPAIGARLYFLHVVHSADYKERAERQQQRTLEVSPRRGNIYDRNGNELAVSIKVDS